MMSDATAGLVLRSYHGHTYRFDPGALCLELLPTGGPGEFARWEVLHGPGDLRDWAARCRLAPTPPVAVAAPDPGAARRLRDALWRVVLAQVREEQASSRDLAVINAAAARPPLVPAIGEDGGRTWAGAPTGDQLLATVARDAVELLTGPYAHRIRMCASETCQLVYVDTSRPGRRRWCSMEHCGNRNKVRALRARQEEG